MTVTPASDSHDRVPLLSSSTEPPQSQPGTPESPRAPHLKHASSGDPAAGPSTLVPPSSPSSRCLICLDDRPSADFSRALRCAHPVCEACLRTLWEHNVMVDSDPFPRCPMPGCAAYASDATVSALLPARIAKRMRQLRGLKPARAADGRRLYCIADGCFEQLPPPPPRSVNAARDAGSDSEDEVMVSTCPDCGTSACMRCGCREHPGSSCTVPLLCARQQRLYNAYAVGRVSACPRCGVHVERDGGCETMSCTRCKWSFTFTPFRSAEEVEQAAVVEDVAIPEPPALTVWGVAFSQLFLAAYFMVWGTGFGALAFVTLVESLLKAVPRWDLLFLVPFVLFGMPSFLIGSARFLIVCARLLPHVGHPAAGSVYMAFCMIVLSAVMLVLQAAVGRIAEKIALWQWVLFFLPFILCGFSLLTIGVTHLVVLGGRTAWTRWREWEPLEDSGDMDGEPAADGTGELETGETMV